MDKVRYIRVAPGDPVITISGRADLVDLHISFIEAHREHAPNECSLLPMPAPSLYPKESPLSSDTPKSGATVCRHMNEPFECEECQLNLIRVNEKLINGACIE